MRPLFGRRRGHNVVAPIFRELGHISTNPHPPKSFKKSYAFKTLTTRSSDVIADDCATLCQGI